MPSDYTAPALLLFEAQVKRSLRFFLSVFIVSRSLIQVIETWISNVILRNEISLFDHHIYHITLIIMNCSQRAMNDPGIRQYLVYFVLEKYLMIIKKTEFQRKKRKMAAQIMHDHKIILLPFFTSPFVQGLWEQSFLDWAWWRKNERKKVLTSRRAVGVML